MTDYYYDPVYQIPRQKGIERRAGCFGNAIRYGVGGGIIALLLWVLFSMCSCASTKNMEKTEYNDSTRTHIVYDTITVTITDNGDGKIA